MQQQLTAVRNSAVNSLLVEEKELEKAVGSLEKVGVCPTYRDVDMHVSSTHMRCMNEWMHLQELDLFRKEISEDVIKLEKGLLGK